MKINIKCENLKSFMLRFVSLWMEVIYSSAYSKVLCEDFNVNIRAAIVVTYRIMMNKKEIYFLKCNFSFFRRGNHV